MCGINVSLDKLGLVPYYFRGIVWDQIAIAARGPATKPTALDDPTPQVFKTLKGQSSLTHTLRLHVSNSGNLFYCTALQQKKATMIAALRSSITSIKI